MSNLYRVLLFVNCKCTHRLDSFGMRVFLRTTQHIDYSNLNILNVCPLYIQAACPHKYNSMAHHCRNHKLFRYFLASVEYHSMDKWSSRMGTCRRPPYLNYTLLPGQVFVFVHDLFSQAKPPLRMPLEKRFLRRADTNQT